MHQRSSLRRFGAALALAASVAACGGAASGRHADEVAGGAGPIATPAMSPSTPSDRAPDPASPISGVATPRPTAMPAISTTEASDLLRQVDDLLRQADGDLTAVDDAAISMGE